jgi:hypothetical protein
MRFRQILKIRRATDAEIDEPQPAILEQNNIIRFDVAVDDAAAVQGRDGARQACGDRGALSKVDARFAPQPPLQRLAIVIWHHRIQPALSAREQFDDFADERTSHPRRNPGFIDEGEPVGCVIGNGGCGNFKTTAFPFCVSVARISRL